jgi:hypothetical protein
MILLSNFLLCCRKLKWIPGKICALIIHFITGTPWLVGELPAFHSVKNGLNKIREEGIVFIHDGVRPLVSSQTIDNCYAAAVEKGNALPVIAPSESLREATGHLVTGPSTAAVFSCADPANFQSYHL